MIEEGMIVKYTPEWSRPEERHLRMVVLEAWPDIRRCKVQHLDTNMVFQPVEVVDFDMVFSTGINVKGIKITK